MSVDCNWCLTFSGKNPDFKKIVSALYKIEDIDEETDRKQIFPKISINKGEIICSNLWCNNIWGYNYLDPDVDIYLYLAKAAPKAKWTIESDRTSLNGGEGCKSYLEVIYDEGKLEFKTQTYIDTVTLPMLIERMEINVNEITYGNFCNYYKVDKSIDENMFKKYLSDEDYAIFYFDYRENTVSVEHQWVTSVYTMDSDGTIRDEKGDVDSYLMKRVEKIENTGISFDDDF